MSAGAAAALLQEEVPARVDEGGAEDERRASGHLAAILAGAGSRGAASGISVPRLTA